MLKIIKHKKRTPKLKDPIFIFGMGGGLGQIAKITGDYIIENLKMQKLISIYGDLFTHSVYVNENDEIELFGAHLYYKKLNGKNDLLVLSGETQPYDERAQYEFSKLILDLLKDFNTKLIVTVGGYDVGVEPDEPGIYITGNDKKIVKEMVKKYPSLKDSFYGTIVGLAGLLVGLSKLDGIPGIVLLAETIGHPMYVSMKGARSILKCLNELFDLNIDLTKIEEEIRLKEGHKEALKKARLEKKDQTKSIRKRLTYIG